MNEGLDRLRSTLREMGSTLVAFSGGVDSAVVAKMAAEVLGDRAAALTAVSPTLPPEELEQARALAREHGIQLFEVNSGEVEREGYARNDGQRCYFCKDELFELAEARRRALGWSWVADGTVTDDLGQHRPGLKAASAHRVRHPLVEAGLRKAQVRDIARVLGLEVWDKPSFACLGSRFPVGTRVTSPKLTRVARVESALRQVGMRQLRVRWHEIGDDVLARIELDPEDIHRAASPQVRARLIEACKEAGIRWVTLDLIGYRSP